MKMRNAAGAGRGGFALIIVLGVMLALMIYLATVQGAVLMTRAQGSLAAQRQDVAETLAAAVTQALASGQPTRSTLKLVTPAGRPASATFHWLTADDPFWRSTPLLKPLPGDELLTVLLPEAPGGALRTRYLVNRQGGRPGVLALDRGGPSQPSRKSGNEP